MTRAEAVREWDAAERKDKEQEDQDGGQTTRWSHIKLPCWRCSSERGELPLTMFTSAWRVSDVWSRTIAKGQDLMCLKCSRDMGAGTQRAVRIMTCDGCCVAKLPHMFSRDMVERWKGMEDVGEILCKQCTGERSKTGRVAQSLERYACCGIGCSSDSGQKVWPEEYFAAAHLVRDAERQQTSVCAKCVVLERRDQGARFACNKCGVEKHITEYSQVFCKQYLMGERRELNYRCLECQFPKCDRCEARPEKPVSANHVDSKGKWLCRVHRYPPCSGCGKAKTDEMIAGKNRLKQWRCEECQNSGSVCDATTGRQDDVGDVRKDVDHDVQTREDAEADGGPGKVERRVQCAECHRWKEKGDFRYTMGCALAAGRVARNSLVRAPGVVKLRQGWLVGPGDVMGVVQDVLFTRTVCATIFL
eukprot:6057638-Pyramimonas_sp.AAC.3